MDDKWFKAQKKRAGVTNADIARRLGRDHTVVSKIVAGSQKMTFEWANAFAQVLGVPLAEVLSQAGQIDSTAAQQLRPGFAESDAVAWVPGPALREASEVQAIASALGADRPGVDVWIVKSRSMAIGGYLEGDYLVVDTHQSERVKAGDVVIAQIYNNNSGTASTVLRRFQPPVLVAASVDPDDQRVHVVDGVNVVIRGKVTASWRS
jgi:transcriptional regulator with XRE-family HTH domain